MCTNFPNPISNGPATSVAVWVSICTNVDVLFCQWTANFLEQVFLSGLTCQWCLYQGIPVNSFAWVVKKKPGGELSSQPSGCGRLKSTRFVSSEWVSATLSTNPVILVCDKKRNQPLSLLGRREMGSVPKELAFPFWRILLSSPSHWYCNRQHSSFVVLRLSKAT